MTLVEFAKIFALLAVQLQFTDADEATIRAYYQALKDLELEFVAMAADRMGKRGGSESESPHWFPKSSEWRKLAMKIEGERAELVTRQVREYHKVACAPLCQHCDDSGWQVVPDRTTQRWKHCSCRTLRRLEMLGRRPLPQLPEKASS